MTTLFFRINKAGALVGFRQFTGPQITLGRDPGSSLVLDDETVSAVHAMIEQRGENYFLTDLGSVAGTLKNGSRIIEDQISSGDTIGIGVFVIEFSVGVPRPKTEGETTVVMGANPLKAPPADASVKPSVPPAKVGPAATTQGPASASATKPPETKSPEVKAAVPSETKPPEVKAAVPPETKPPEVKAIVPPEVAAKVPEKKSAEPQVVKPKNPVQPKIVEQPVVAAPKIPPSNIGAKTTTSAGAGIESIKRQPPAKINVPMTPPSKTPNGRSLRDIVKPSKGTTIEVVVGWGDRVLNSYHFSDRKTVTAGPHPKNDIVIPVLTSGETSTPILRIEEAVQVYIPSGVDGELTRASGSFRISDLAASGKLGKTGSGFILQLQQDELIRLDLEAGVSIFIRYVGASPKPIALPLLDLSASELMALVGAAVVMFILALIVQVANPPGEKSADEKKDEPIRKVHFEVVKKERVVVAEVTKEVSPQVGASPKPDETKIAKNTNVNVPGPKEKPAEARPNEVKTPGKKATSTQVGKTGAQRPTPGSKRPDGGTPDTAPKPKVVDISKMGLLGAFGGKGTQTQINQAVQGADAVGGLGKGAGGKLGAGQGDNANASEPGLKSTGSGGKGTATVGISGVNTAGRGGGNTGYGTQELGGGKKSASIVAGGTEENFVGTIDREAIRRVVMANRTQLKACYERALNRDPGLYGKIVIEWVIGSGGHVVEGRVKSTTMNNTEVEQCCVSRIRSWQFPSPPKNQEAVVSFPFTFNKD